MWRGEACQLQREARSKKLESNMEDATRVFITTPFRYLKIHFDVPADIHPRLIATTGLWIGAEYV